MLGRAGYTGISSWDYSLQCNTIISTELHQRHHIIHGVYNSYWLARLRTMFSFRSRNSLRARHVKVVYIQPWSMSLTFTCTTSRYYYLTNALKTASKYCAQYVYLSVCLSARITQQVYLLTPMDRATLPHAKSAISRCTPCVISSRQ